MQITKSLDSQDRLSLCAEFVGVEVDKLRLFITLAHELAVPVYTDGLENNLPTSSGKIALIKNDLAFLTILLQNSLSMDILSA